METINTPTLYEVFTEKGVFCSQGVLSHIGLSAVGDNFLATWFALIGVTIAAVAFTSGPLFYYYYWPSQVTYEKWTRKSNPKFPSPEKVRDEIVQMLKGVFCAALCPAASVWAAVHGHSKAYCGTNTPFGNAGSWESVGYHALTFILVLLISDFWEFYYHYLGHNYKIFWEQHKHHHKFFNPSPFAVIADEFVDQFFRALPLALFPLVAPINIDLMFFEYGVFFYAYGCYLHWGYESDYLDAHNPIINTAFQHYCHHARAIMNKPYHCGFFFKIWDQLFGSMYEDECFCVKCERAKGNRSEDMYKRIVVPDYHKLLSAKFWFSSASVLTGATSKDVNKDILTASHKSNETDEKKTD
jgi:lathosterol oxidase